MNFTLGAFAMFWICLLCAGFYQLGIEHGDIWNRIEFKVDKLSEYNAQCDFALALKDRIEGK